VCDGFFSRARKSVREAALLFVLSENKTRTLDRPPGLLETSVPGVFAVGDVRHGSVKRVASGVGEGSIAIQFVHQYLAKV